MNQNIVDYLTQNKNQYSPEVLSAQLRKAGYLQMEINEAAQFIYASNSFVPAPSASNQSDLHYAGFWIRVAASLIDGLILSFTGMALGMLFFFLTEILLGLKEENILTTFLLIGIANLFIYSLFFFYFIWMTYKFQATLGKMALGLRIYTDSATLEKPTLGRVFGRELGKILSGLAFYVGFMMAGFTQKKQALHDMLAKTVVVYKN